MINWRTAGRKAAGCVSWSTRHRQQLPPEAYISSAPNPAPAYPPLKKKSGPLHPAFLCLIVAVFRAIQATVAPPNRIAAARVALLHEDCCHVQRFVGPVGHRVADRWSPICRRGAAEGKAKENRDDGHEHRPQGRRA